MNKLNVTDLKWETDFLGIKSCLVDCDRELTIDDIEFIKELQNQYDFMTIKNRNNNFENNRLLGKTSAYVADINQQFIYKNSDLKNESVDRSITEITESLSKLDNDIVEQLIDSSFTYSRFFYEKSLPIQKSYIYQEWFQNSVGDSMKKIICLRDEDGIIRGFSIYRHDMKNKRTIIELICSNLKSSGTKFINYFICQIKLDKISLST